ncbi:GNAT family N-acetyltransferase [Actinomycetospora termitidis]|uniref:GNAT family N-acetyltransferase n=1 Tax=Actinomycetospora termitidis TaxID=3053470 RepID=A0ABT7MCK4_9PSEU|nr:GNAT family N-acetyltransferase [Actinomycetospora sp. Odt1-22]MDL5158392.1 GNAT family N-acetyltransferase [Actinomycetospora sp. Odt1-22]
MVVRPARADDAEAMAAVVEAVAPEGTLGAQPPVDVAARARGYRELIGGEGAAAWVLATPAVVGFLTLYPRTPGVLGLAMALVASARGRGGGRALVDAGLAWAGTTDAHKVDLEVWPDNGRAIGLYAATGFVVEGLRDRHYRRADGTLRSSLIMARRLD